MTQPKITGQQLLQLRKRLGYTQQQLATELGVSRKTLLDWEHQPTISSLTALAVVALASTTPALVEQIYSAVD
jgi:DNA-binding XRE family transcriptional regulator